MCKGQDHWAVGGRGCNYPGQQGSVFLGGGCTQTITPSSLALAMGMLFWTLHECVIIKWKKYPCYLCKSLFQQTRCTFRQNTSTLFNTCTCKHVRNNAHDIPAHSYDLSRVHNNKKKRKKLLGVDFDDYMMYFIVLCRRALWLHVSTFQAKPNLWRITLLVTRDGGNPICAIVGESLRFQGDIKINRNSETFAIWYEGNPGLCLWSCWLYYTNS